MLFGTAVPLYCVGLLLLAGLTVLLLRYRPRASGAQRYADATSKFLDAFIVKPYLQLGNRPGLLSREALEVLWFVSAKVARKHRWSVQVRITGDASWRTPVVVKGVDFDLHEVKSVLATELTAFVPFAPPSCVAFQAAVKDLPPGARFQYRVLADDVIAFASEGKARNSASQPYSFAVVGDLGLPKKGKEQKIAHRISLAAPDFIMIPGDIVYHRGRVTEYFKQYFPVYNSDDSNAQSGAPLLRSVLTFASPGNHDVAMPGAEDRPDFSEFGDVLGYFLLWDQPLNGPSEAESGLNTPRITGAGAAQDCFRKLAGKRFPQMASFSYDWGNSHWLVLDGNPYMDWTDSKIRDWVERDLAAAKDSTWRFVSVHQPPFCTDGNHGLEQRIRLLAPIFEKYGVDIVFAGHIHCYERSHPLRFQPDKLETKLHTEECPVPGTFEIDTIFDGKVNKRPNGTIYVITGAGGAKMHDSRVSGAPALLKPYTSKYLISEHSFTSCQVDGKALVMRQIGEDGAELDSITLEK